MNRYDQFIKTRSGYVGRGIDSRYLKYSSIDAEIKRFRHVESTNLQPMKYDSS